MENIGRCLVGRMERIPFFCAFLILFAGMFFRQDNLVFAGQFLQGFRKGHPVEVHYETENVAAFIAAEAMICFSFGINDK